MTRKQAFINGKGHKWSDEELKDLMQMWDQEKSVALIAKKLKSSHSAISKMIVRLRRQGIPLKRRDQGRKIGEDVGKSWTPGEVEFLIRRRNEKATCEQIASELKRTNIAVNGMIRRLRQEGVEVKMLGMGVRRLWNPENLRALALSGNL